MLWLSCPCRSVVHIEKWCCGLYGNHFVMLSTVCFSWVFVCFMLRANLMSHHCRCFREGLSGKRTALGVDPGVFLIRLGMRNHCRATYPSTQTRKESYYPRVPWTAVQAGLSACGAFQCSSQAEMGRVEGSSEYCNPSCPGGDCNIGWELGLCLNLNAQS